MEIHLRVFVSLKYVEINTQTDRRTACDFNVRCAGMGTRLKWLGMIIRILSKIISNCARCFSSREYFAYWKACGVHFIVPAGAVC